MNDNAKAGSNIRLQRPEGKIPKVAKQWANVSRKDTEPESKPHKNDNPNKVNEEKLLISANNNYAANTTSLMSEDNFHSMTEIPLEAANTDDLESPRSVGKEKIKMPEKLPSKANPEDFESQSVSKTKAKKSKLLQNSKASETIVAKSSIDSAKKFVVTSTDIKSEGTTKKIDSGNETLDLKSSSKQLARSDVPKDKLNSQNHCNLSKPSDDKLGTSVDPV